MIGGPTTVAVKAQSGLGGLHGTAIQGGTDLVLKGLIPR